MKDVLVCVLNHKSRSTADIEAMLTEEGIHYKVFTDETDYKDSRDTRWLGLVLNYLNILKYETDSLWKLIIHDDIEINRDTFSKVKHVLDSAPKSIVSFYNPTNKGYKNCFESSHYVLKTYSNWWSQCHAFPKILEKNYLKFCEENPKYVNHYAEDGLLSRFLSLKNVPLYSVVPSFIQHVGYDKSTFNLPAKVGKNLRNSATYDSGFDVEAIDWKKEFANPYLDNQKKKFSELQ